MKLKTKRFTNNPLIRFNLKKLKDLKIAEGFQAKVGGKCAALCVFESDVDTLENCLKVRLLSTAECALERKRKKIQLCVTNEVLGLYYQRRQLKQQKHTGSEAGPECRKVYREVRKKMKAAQGEWTEEQRKNIEEAMMSENSKEAHNPLKALTKTQQHKSAVIEDSSGNILPEGTAVLNRWTEYCSALYKYELHPDTSLVQSNQTPA